MDKLAKTIMESIDLLRKVDEDFYSEPDRKVDYAGVFNSAVKTLAYDLSAEDYTETGEDLNSIYADIGDYENNGYHVGISMRPDGQVDRIIVSIRKGVYSESREQEHLDMFLYDTRRFEDWVNEVVDDLIERDAKKKGIKLPVDRPAN